MARVRYLDRDNLAPEHRHVYDELAQSRGRVDSNFKALLNSPEAISRMAPLGAYVRFETPLPARTKVLAILTTARESKGHYVWTVNEPQALSAGVEQDTIDAIREGRALQVLDADDTSIVRFTLELLQQHRISDETFRAVQQRLGDSGVVDLVILIGYYLSLSHALSALEVDSPAGVSSTLSA